ncbi:serine/threonine-protein kinase ULK4 [Lampris incognitus]|uniref:serine/threonine-protein kinase ULK4 n=1 Tax=Lampris incognitus TaxID=2546036 RepID=UPI0024B58405|nr:serine/threonine-protein kinase ULK4 [Lampris incognitus]
MENFILYEELGKGSRSVVYKGRRKGSLNYVAIICTDKTKRPELTNHVRLSIDLSHRNIVAFYEWYETSNHLWMVVELCTGGSLEAVIGQDGCLSENVVRGFGRDLVRGLKYLHKLGIIFSDLTPAKILLDGHGILKLSNFCLSKADGELLEEFFILLSASEEAAGGGEDEMGESDSSSISKRLRGSPVYSAPEVLQGAETSTGSDLWALGCILYYMYTGKPPFYSDSYTELAKMIVYQEPPPPQQTMSPSSTPSEELQSLLKGLLNKNPDKRMDWPELLVHPFWRQVLKEEEEEEEEEKQEEENEGENDSEGEDSSSSKPSAMAVQSSDGNSEPQSEERSDRVPNRATQDPMNARTTSTDEVDDSGTASVHLVVLSTIVRRWVNPQEGGRGPTRSTLTWSKRCPIGPRKGPMGLWCDGGIWRTGMPRRTSPNPSHPSSVQARRTWQPQLRRQLHSWVRETVDCVEDMPAPPGGNHGSSLTHGDVAEECGTNCVSELRPKRGVDEDSIQTIFLLSSRATPRRSCSIRDAPSHHPPLQANICADNGDIISSVKALLYTDSDLTITPVMDNPKILKSPPVRFEAKTLCVPVYSVEKLKSLSNEDWRLFLQQLCSSLDGQTSSSAARSSSAMAPPASTALRSKLNLLCYLCCVVGHKDIATRLINSKLLPVLTQLSRQAPNWDIRSKVLRVMGLLALHCTELREDSPVNEAATMLTELLRENQRNSKLKQFLLPPLGELLYLIASQEEKRGSPEGLRFAPAAAYTGLMRSLREGDDAVVQHMAAKAIENISTTVTGSSHYLVSMEIGPALWYRFTHSTAEAVRITAISSLSRLTRAVPGVFLPVIDRCGPAAILACVSGAGVRVQQHLLTVMGTALLSTRSHTHRMAQDRDLVLKVLCCLESPSTVVRAKALLLLMLLIQDNTHTLMHCCQHRLVMYLERDLRKAGPLRENPSQTEYLSRCLDVFTAYLTRTAPLILEDVLVALGAVVGRRHPSPAQSRQLKHTLPTMSVVLDLLTSQVFRSKIVTENFLSQIGVLLNYIISIESNEANLASAVGAAVCEELIRTTLSLVEVLSQHSALITTHHHTVENAILPPLMTLAFSRNVEWCVCVLRVLSEFSLLLQAGSGAEDEREERMEGEGNKEERELGSKRKGEDRTAEGGKGHTSSNQLLALITTSLLPRYDSLLSAEEPVSLYALKLLVSMTEHSADICRLIKHIRILPVVFQLVMANSRNVASGLVQHAVALLCNLTGGTEWDLEPLYQQGLVEVVVTILTEAAVHCFDGQGHIGRKADHLVLVALLELLHNILNHTSTVVRSALQSQRLSCAAAEKEAAEKLLLSNRPLGHLNTHLIHMLSTEDQEVWEESIQCLSLLVQLYGGEGYDCLSPSCRRSFSHMLRSHARSLNPRMQRTTLRVIKRLAQTADRSDWWECSEGEELVNLLQDLTHSNRSQVDVAALAAEVLQVIHSL